MFVTRLRRLLGIKATTLLCWTFAVASGAAAPARAQETLAQAKVLYAAASYEEALAMLDKLNVSEDQDATAIAEYRIFCLLALGRSEDAHRTIETVLRANPFYKPSEAQVPPRIQTVIKSTRQKLLPGIVLSSYADAKAAYERKDPTAAAKFDHVLMLLDDPDAKNVASLADLRTVSVGFRDLARAASQPPPAPVVAAAPPPASAVATPPPATPAVPAAGTPAGSASAAGSKPAGAPPAQASGGAPNRAATANAPAAAKVIYDATDMEVVPPVVVNQRLPTWQPTSGPEAKATFKGVLHLIIDDRGNVTTADMRVPTHPLYDEELIRAARTWKFRAAMRGGIPVAYMKLISITLSPTK
jgi:hypothetical protein